VRPRRRRRSAQAGFTLVELMISLVLFSFVIAGVLAVAVAMAAGFREQKITIGAESSARAVMEFMAEAVRGASPAVPTGAVTAIAGTPSGDIENLDDPACARGAIAITNDNVGPDELTIVFAYGSVVTSSTSLFDPSAPASIDVVDATGLAAGDMILVTNYVNGHLAKIASVAGTTLTLDSPQCGAPTIAGTHAAGAVVVRVARARFYIADLDLIPTLWMDPDAEGAQAAEPMAEGIEDMQFSIGVDTDGDGQLSEAADGLADEWFFNAPTAVEVLPVGSPRALKVSLLARAVGRVTGTGTYLPPALGDRVAGVTADNFRRRVLTSIVEIRNLQGSR